MVGEKQDTENTVILQLSFELLEDGPVYGGNKRSSCDSRADSIQIERLENTSLANMRLEIFESSSLVNLKMAAKNVSRLCENNC